jgi:predicted transcriptional regulator of viral defense system
VIDLFEPGERSPEPRELADWLLARGRHWATTEEVAGLLDLPERNVAPTLAKWRQRGLLFAPTKGLWVMIPPEFRSWGVVPGMHFVDAWMRHLGHNYYVALLSAAEVHGFAHQRPQVLQVMTGARLRDRSFQRVRFQFVYSRHLDDRTVEIINTPTGTARVASRATTAFDVVSFPRLSGGLSNVATVLGDMLDEQALEPDLLAREASRYPASVVARTGWLLDFMAERLDLRFDTSGLLTPAAARANPILLDPSGIRAGERDDRWNVIVNAYPEEESS